MAQNDYVATARRDIAVWENEAPGYIAQVSNVLLKPVEFAYNKIVPSGLQDGVTSAIEKFLLTLNSGAGWTVNSAEIESRLKTIRASREIELQARDLAAKHYWNWNIGYGATQGAATGAAGMPGLVANVPLVMTVALRTIQQVAACYGYDAKSPEEREYILHVLQNGASSDLRVKVHTLIALKEIEQILLKVTWKKMSEAYAARELSKLSLLAALREFAKKLGMELTKRKALQMVPVVGAAVGATFDAAFINDIGRAAYMNYRRRWLLELPVRGTVVANEPAAPEADSEAAPAAAAAPADAAPEPAPSPSGAESASPNIDEFPRRKQPQRSTRR